MRPGNPVLYKPAFKIVVLIAGFAVLISVAPGYASNSPESYTLANSLFAVLLALAAVCFSFAGSISGEPKIADRITFAGERLLHGGLLIITTTAIRYVAFMVTEPPESAEMHITVLIPLYALIALCGAVFIYGVVFAITGFRVLSDVLIDKMFRHDDWDDLL